MQKSLILLCLICLLLEVSCKKKNNPLISSARITVTDVDGNIYHTVTIGTQIWMVENLKTTKYSDGTPIPNISDDNLWGIQSSAAYCNYNDSSSYADIYGRLYNWYAVTNSHNICPKGWHIPTDSEFTILSNFLCGYNIAGGKLKDNDTTLWQCPNIGATNISGFSGLPGGGRYGAGMFYDIRTYGTWWCADTTNATTVFLTNTNSKVSRSTLDMTYGCSIRCLKN